MGSFKYGLLLDNSVTSCISSSTIESELFGEADESTASTTWISTGDVLYTSPSISIEAWPIVKRPLFTGDKK